VDEVRDAPNDHGGTVHALGAAASYAASLKVAKVCADIDTARMAAPAQDLLSNSRKGSHDHVYRHPAGSTRRTGANFHKRRER